jgi:hypothetical protein
VELVASAWADGTTVTFRVPDPGYRLASVRLSQDVRIPGDQLDFRAARTNEEGWELTIGQPPVTRMEYLLELRYRDGGAETVTDPGNPRRVDGAFGPKSVLEFAAYRPQSLRKLQYPVELHELPDMHNYTAWRDGFDPQLTRLLHRVCR